MTVTRTREMLGWPDAALRMIDDMDRQLRRERTAHALTRRLLGFCMLALDRIIDGAPRRDPSDDYGVGCWPETTEEYEDVGYAAARFNDAGTARIAKSQVTWLRRATRDARSADDIKAAALLLTHRGFMSNPDEARRQIASTHDPLNAARKLVALGFYIPTEVTP